MIKNKKSMKPESKPRMEESPIQMMPNEMLDKIFSFLPLKCKRLARLVSKRWLRILNYHDLVLNVQLSDKTISNVKYFTQPHLASLTVNKLTQDICIVHGSANEVVVPTISKLILSDAIPYQYLVNVLKHYKSSNITELEFGSFSVTLTGPGNGLKLATAISKWSCLKILKLSAVPYYTPAYLNTKYIGEFTKYCQGLAGVLKYICIPTLTNLCLNLDSGSMHLDYLNVSGKSPFDSIYLELPNFLHRQAIYDKLECLEIKFIGDYFHPAGTQFPPDLWSKSVMVQFDSLKLELLQFNWDYMLGLCSTQRKVKLIEIESSYPDLLSNLLENNSTTLESLRIHGATMINFISFPPSCYATELKCLSIGFHGMNILREFVNNVHILPSRDTPTSTLFPNVVFMNLVDTHFVIGKYLVPFRTTYGTRLEPQIEDVPTILEWILPIFPALVKLRFIVRGDSIHVSEIKEAANSILEKVRDLKTMRITTSDARHVYFTKGMKVKKYIKLFCNLMMPLKKSSADLYYERVVEVTFQELKSTVQPFSTMSPNQNQLFYQPSRPLF